MQKFTKTNLLQWSVRKLKAYVTRHHIPLDTPSGKRGYIKKDYVNGIYDLFKNHSDSEETPQLGFQQIPKSVGSYLRGWQMDVQENHPFSRDPLGFLVSVRPLIRQKLTDELVEFKQLKYQLALQVRMNNGITGDTAYPVFRTKQKATFSENDIEDSLTTAFPEIIENLEKWTGRGSGWSVDKVQKLWLDIAKYQPLRGGSYIPLPSSLKGKKAIINVKNKDDNCLRWALRSALFPAEKNCDRCSSYPKEDGLNFEGIEMPTPISQIAKVEKQNNLAINVFGWDGQVIVHRLSRNFDGAKTINLLVISKDEKFHYTWVKNLNRLLYDQNKHKGQTFFCERCLHGYSRKCLLEAHKSDCKKLTESPVRIEMPIEGENIIKFQNFHKQMKTPFVIYADFETLLCPTFSGNQKKSEKTQKHVACGFCYIVVRSDGVTKPPFVYRGEDAAEKFLQALKEEQKHIKNTLRYPKPMKIETVRHHEEATHCWICEKPFYPHLSSEEKKKWGKVRDHCHITGNYRGAAHSLCNVKLRLNPDTTEIPVVFHNLRGYDSHLIMQAISKVSGDITCIPNNTEKYISFSLGKLKFIDSFQFLPTSLDRLVSASACDTFKITRNYENDPNKQKLLLRKGVYPYEYMDGWNCFNEGLPPKESFYSKLNDEQITDADYEHAKMIWKTFECKNMGDYHDLYLRTDVLLLADVYEKYRETCLKQYKLDPAHYYTSPGLSWDALLKKTKINLELLTDCDMHLMIEKGLRGGISMVSERFCKANNPYVDAYDASKPNNYIMYLDANNLYGWSMSQSLPTGGFKWVENSRFAKIFEDLNAGIFTEDQKKSGYILEVDLEYPTHLHEAHNSYPLAPENISVPAVWYSEYQRNLTSKDSVPKLVPNLRFKEKYVIHYRTLQLYLQLGLKLTNIHRVIEFNQSPWMEPYIRMNTELRKKATSDFEKDLYKLMNNSVFGKTMENLRKRVNVKLVRACETEKMRKLIANPSFGRQVIFDDDLAALHMHKTKLKMNRPVYVGMCVLDLSKHLMYDFFYNKLKTQYKSKCNLLYTDTDSLLMNVETEDFYKDMESNLDLYDTSDYPKNHTLHCMTNKKVLGKMKDECSGIPIVEYVGLRPKMYSILTGESEIRKAKGVKKYVVKKELRHSLYKEVLFHKKTTTHNMNMIRSEKHQIYSMTVNKISLSPVDTKRWIANDGIHTYAYGYALDKFS